MLFTTTAYVADTLDTTEEVLADCLDLDDLWPNNGTGTAALSADIIARIAARP